jgi:NAD+ diphosphatase
VVLHEGAALLTASGGLALVPPSSVASHVLAVFLGRSPAGASDVAAGAPIVALVVDDAVADKLGGPWGDLRSLGWRLDARDAGLFTQAVALVNWHEAAAYSPRTGAPTVATQSGWVRIDPDTGAEHFPRTDPAVIVAVVDADDRLLLGSNALWEAHRFSLLAGFVEPGESLEAAVVREVFEEAGIVVTDPVYLGSQPWPFPASLMVGFRASVAEGAETEVQPDGEEIVELRWFTREQLAASLDEVLLPGRSSIARAMIEDWYGGRLGDAASDRVGESVALPLREDEA